MIFYMPPGGLPPGIGGRVTMDAIRERRLMIQWACALILPIAIYAACASAALPHAHVLFYVVTSAALALWALSLLSDTIVAITLPILYVMLGLVQPSRAFGPWSSSVGWIMLGGLVFAQIMMRTGLARRLALWALYVTRGSFTRLLWGILLGGFIVAPCIPSIMGKAALISVICIGMCEALNLEKRSTPASAILLAGFLAIGTSKMGFLTGGADIVLYMGQMARKMGVQVSWGDYFLHNFPLSVIYAALSMLVLLIMLRPKVNVDFEGYVSRAHAELGPMSGQEKKSAALILVLIALLMTDRVHGIDAGWIIILLSFIAFLPGIRLMNDENFGKMPLASVFFVVGCMSIGATAQAVGVDKALAGIIAPVMRGSSELACMLFAYLSGAAVNFMLTSLPAYSSMTVPLTEIALEMGVNPMPVLYSFSFGLDQYIFPYEYAVLLFFYATGWISLKHVIAVFSVRFVVTGVFLPVFAYPWWKFCGLF